MSKGRREFIVTLVGAGAMAALPPCVSVLHAHVHDFVSGADPKRDWIRVCACGLRQRDGCIGPKEWAPRWEAEERLDYDCDDDGGGPCGEEPCEGHPRMVHVDQAIPSFHGRRTYVRTDWTLCHDCGQEVEDELAALSRQLKPIYPPGRFASLFEQESSFFKALA